MPSTLTLTPAEQDELAHAMVVANTPSSFLKWLEKSAPVRRLADEGNEDGVLDLLHKAANVAPKTEVTLATAYACLAALVVQRRRVGQLGAIPVAVETLQWAGPIWDIASRRSTTTANIILTAQPPMTSLTVVDQASPGSSVIVDQHGQPAIVLK
jgi:hypothetical protein